MCVRQVLVKSVSPYGLRSSFVPCGKCEDCRDSKKMQWQFRLRCELDFCRKQKWHIGFFTLTYDDAHLPYIASAYYKTESDIPASPIPCFSRKDVRTFIDNIRKRLFELNGTTAIRYMICSEYGSSERTHRPHYHGLISFPPTCDPRKVFDLIKHYWSKGFVFPRRFDGGLDSHGYRHKSFLLAGDVKGAAVYGAKYVCKDIGFYAALNGCELVDKDDPLWTYLKDCMPFHIQSRSIGKSYLSNLSSADLLRLLREGESFVGNNRKVHLPLYIKNKILYNPKYVFVERTSSEQPSADWWYDFEADKWRYKKGAGTHYRQVTKEASKFFIENYEQIYQQRKEYYRQFFKDISIPEYWYNRGCKRGVAKLVDSLRSVPPDDFENFVNFFISYYGVPKEYWFSGQPARQYLLRFLTPDKLPKKSSSTSFVFRNETLYEKIINTVLTRMQYVTAVDKDKRARIAETKDFYSHQI